MFRHLACGRNYTCARSHGTCTALNYARISGEKDTLVDGWKRAGFDVQDGKIKIGFMEFELAHGRPISVDFLKFQNLPENVETINSSIQVGGNNARTTDVEHPNGIFRVDHIVIRTTEIHKVEKSLSSELNLTLRRRAVRDEGTSSMLFYREPGEPEAPIIEVVAAPPKSEGGHATYVWGLALVANDLERLRVSVGEEYTSEIRSAKQAGRSICTIKGIELGTKVAVMTPHRDRRRQNSKL